MLFTKPFFIIILLSLFLHTILSHPVPQSLSDEDYEDRRRKHKRKRRPCVRDAPGMGRWFFGHDLTLFLGDVTILTNPCGGSNGVEHPQTTSDSSNDGNDGHKPIFQRPPFGGHRPGHHHQHNRPGGHKPVFEEVEEEEPAPEEYRPGPVVGALNNQVTGQTQNLSNFNPTGFFSQISRHFNRIVNPFIDLFI